MRGKAHSDSVKAAVIGALMAGRGVSEVAKEYGVDHSLVSRWKAAIPQDQLHRLHEVALQRERDFGAMMGDSLEQNLKALTTIAGVASEAEYIRQQPAGALAELYETLAIHGLRLIEMGQRSRASGFPERNGMDH